MHKLKFLRQSSIIYKNKIYNVDVYECVDCGKLKIIDLKTQESISLDGAMGEEI